MLYLTFVQMNNVDDDGNEGNEADEECGMYSDEIGRDFNEAAKRSSNIARITNSMNANKHTETCSNSTNTFTLAYLHIELTAV